MGSKEKLQRVYVKKFNLVLGFWLKSLFSLCCQQSLVTSNAKVKGFVLSLRLFKFARVHLLYVHISYSFLTAD